MQRYKRQWFESASRNPLAWYAALADMPCAEPAVRRCDIPADTRQLWIASPYHAELKRDAVRVYPEGMLPWDHSDAAHLCQVLNPLLAEEGMQLLMAGSALLLACREPMQAWPLGFGEISGKALPNQHHEGEDGGRLNRLLSEIQMLLFQFPNEARHDRGDVDINGIWLWAPMEWPAESHAGILPHVATRNPYLTGLVDGQEAAVVISEAERLHELLPPDVVLPKHILLSGEGHALLLSRSWLPVMGAKKGWRASALQSELALMARLTHLV